MQDWVFRLGYPPYSKQQKYQLNKKVGEHFFLNIQIFQISGIVPFSKNRYSKKFEIRAYFFREKVVIRKNLL